MLALLSEIEYCSVPNVQMVLDKCLFLLALATGSRVSELHTLYRQSEFLAFGGNDSSVTFYSRHLYLAKNEIPVCRRGPIITQDLLGDDGTPHSLCPVGALRSYSNVTKDFQDGPLFLHPTSCSLCVVNSLRSL